MQVSPFRFFPHAAATVTPAVDSQMSVALMGFTVTDGAVTFTVAEPLN